MLFCDFNFEIELSLILSINLQPIIIYDNKNRNYFMYYEYYESITNFMVVIINYILIFSFLSDHTQMNSQDSTHVDRQHINPEKHNFNVLESLPSIVLGDSSKIVAPLTNEHQDTPVPSNSVFYENTTTIPIY